MTTCWRSPPVSTNRLVNGEPAEGRVRPRRSRSLRPRELERPTALRRLRPRVRWPRRGTVLPWRPWLRQGSCAAKSRADRGGTAGIRSCWSLAGVRICAHRGTSFWRDGRHGCFRQASRCRARRCHVSAYRFARQTLGARRTGYRSTRPEMADGVGPLDSSTRLASLPDVAVGRTSAPTSAPHGRDVATCARAWQLSIRQR
jgi:hypothetical protein